MMKYFTLLGMLCLSISVTAQNWEQLADIPFDGRHHAITFSFNGKGYALTGTTETEDYSREFWEYDPFSDTWVQLEDYPGLGRTLGIGDEWDGKFYFGFGESSFLQPSLRLFRDLWVFDPVDTSFTQLPSCPCEGRGHPAFIAHNGKIFVGGGSGRTEDLRDWWIYDIESQEWTQGPDIPGGRRHHPFQFGIGDYVYVGGGHDVNWSRYDPVDNTWTGIDNLPEGRVAGTQFSYNGKGYVLSGHDIDHRDVPVSDIFMEYDPELDEWIKLAPHPGTTRWVPGSFIIDGYVYMFGGTERFPPTGVWAKTAYRYPLEEVMVSTTTVSAPSALSVYPNPGEDVVQLQLDGLMAQPHEAVIYDLLGQEIHRSSLSAPQLRIDFLTTGIYSLKVFNDRKEVGSTLLLKQ